MVNLAAQYSRQSLNRIKSSTFLTQLRTFQLQSNLLSVSFYPKFLIVVFSVRAWKLIRGWESLWLSSGSPRGSLEAHANLLPPYPYPSRSLYWSAIMFSSITDSMEVLPTLPQNREEPFGLLSNTPAGPPPHYTPPSLRLSVCHVSLWTWLLVTMTVRHNITGGLCLPTSALTCYLKLKPGVTPPGWVSQRFPSSGGSFTVLRRHTGSLSWTSSKWWVEMGSERGERGRWDRSLARDGCKYYWRQQRRDIFYKKNAKSTVGSWDDK